jgi:hypothetical protein
MTIQDIEGIGSDRNSYYFQHICKRSELPIQNGDYTKLEVFDSLNIHPKDENIIAKPTYQDLRPTSLSLQ